MPPLSEHKRVSKCFKARRGARSYKIGLKAEFQTCLYFKEQGFTVLAQRCRTPLGEIDALFANSEWLIAVEVKYRQNSKDNYDALSSKQASRLLNALDYVLFYHPEWKRENIRFDLIIFNHSGVPHHIKDALRLF